MQFLRTLLDNLAYLNPIPLAGWLVWLGLAGLLGIALFNWRKYHAEWNARATLILVALILATPFAALFFGLEFSTGSTLPVPGLPEEPAGSTMMIFSAIPWILAGGLLGPIRGGWLGDPQRIVTRRLGYAYPLHGAGSWAHGGDVRSGKPSAVSHVPLSLIAAATFQCVESYPAACRPLCAGHSLYPFRFGIGYGTTGLRI